MRRAHSLRFAYPAFYKWFFGIATLCFFLLYALSKARAAGGSDRMAAALFLSYALVSLYSWCRTWDWVAVDDRTIVMSHLGSATRIHFAEIARVTHLASEHVLVIEGNGRRIHIKKQLEGYGHFYSVVAPRFPHASTDLSPYLPLQVRTRGWVLLRPWLLVLGGLLLLGVASLAPMRAHLLPAVSMAVLGLLLLLVGGYAVYLLPRAYLFGREQLRVMYLLRSRVYPVAELRNVRLVTHTDDLREISCLLLAFKGGTLRLRDQAVDYPPEALIRALKVHYVPAGEG